MANRLLRPFTFVTNRIKKTYDIKAWLGFEHLKESTKTLWEVTRRIFTHQRLSDNMSFTKFEDAARYYQLDDQALAERAQTLRYHILFYLFCAFLLLLYLIFHLYHKHLLLTFLMIPIIAVFLTKAYQNQAYRSQIIRRKLGYSFKQLLTDLLSILK